MNEGRTLPHSLDAERAVLGAVLIDNRVWPAARGAVRPGMFFRDVHRMVFEAIEAVANRSEPMDTLTVKAELQQRGQLDEIGGPGYLAGLLDGVPYSTNVEYYARIVREKSTLRNLIQAGSQIVREAYEDQETVEELIDRAEQVVMAVSAGTVSGDFILADSWMAEVRHLVAEAQRTRQVVTGVPTGLVTLDTFTRGFQPADLIFIGARPSVGKTSLALQLALAASTEQMVGFVSIEMPRRMIGLRAVSMESKVDAYRIMTGRVTSYESSLIAAALDRLEMRQIAIDDSPAQTPAQLRARIRRFASRYGLGIVFIDYMQLLRDEHGREKENRNQELSAISASLKSLARELSIPVVVLSQLSRDSEKTGGARRPQLWHLRDSGALEQDADLVMLLHRPGQHDEERKWGDGEEAQLIIAKHRNGPTGTIKLQWLASMMRFGEVETQRRETA